MKKYIAAVCSVLVVIFALAACGNNAAPSGAPSASSSAQTPSEAQKTENAYGLEDGVYLVDVDTGSNMFHINEAKEGKGELTVKGDQMILHITLPSKNIVNLYLGTKEEAEAAEAAGEALIEPTVDEVTYSDGITEEVYGFDIPMAAIGEPVEVAIIGTHGNWYSHPVTITNPQPVK